MFLEKETAYGQFFSKFSLSICFLLFQENNQNKTSPHFNIEGSLNAAYVGNKVEIFWLILFTMIFVNKYRNQKGIQKTK